MDITTLLLVVAIGMIFGAIVVSILLARHFTKAPSIALVQGKLEDPGDVDINDTIQFLKLTNLE